jgi:predicted transcriptional regulator
MSSTRRSVYLPDEQWTALREIAEAEQRSVNFIVRRGVMHITQRGADELAEQEARARSGAWSSESVAKMLETKDEEIARLKRELAKRPRVATIVAEGSLGAMAAVQGIARNAHEFHPVPKPGKKR